MPEDVSPDETWFRQLTDTLDAVVRRLGRLPPSATHLQRTMAIEEPIVSFARRHAEALLTLNLGQGPFAWFSPGVRYAARELYVPDVWGETLHILVTWTDPQTGRALRSSEVVSSALLREGPDAVETGRQLAYAALEQTIRRVCGVREVERGSLTIKHLTHADQSTPLDGDKP